jgi:hypothetical protein
MATSIYKTKNIFLYDGTEIQIMPLKIKYLREFMTAFEGISKTNDDDQAIMVLLECTRIAMKQYYPKISKSIEELENNIDMPTVHTVLDIAANIKINMDKEEEVKVQVDKSNPGPSWQEFDLAKLESEIFLLGIWKDYGELEESLSISEIMAIVESKRELDYQEKKFLAAIQGVNLDEDSSDKGQKEWEDMKARVFSRGQTGDSNDVLSSQGQNAKKAGFGIGMGLEYENLT